MRIATRVKDLSITPAVTLAKIWDSIGHAKEYERR